MNGKFMLISGLCLAAAVLLGYAGYRTAALPHNYPRWVVYYNNKLPFSYFRRYDIVVLDSDNHPDFTQDKREGQVVLGYISTSEAEAYRSYFPDIEKMKVLLPPNSAGDERMVIDIRKQQWQDYVVHNLVPAVLAKGFDGIMLDTIDTPLYMEEQNPAAYNGMADAAVKLIRAIRKEHPDMKLMLNRGFQVLNRVAGDVDYFLAESICADYDMKKKTSRYFPEDVYDAYVAQLKNAQAMNPQLQVLTLDYWDMTSRGEAEVRSLYARQRANGFIPYVTTIDLAHHHKEPE